MRMQALPEPEPGESPLGAMTESLKLSAMAHLYARGRLAMAALVDLQIAAMRAHVEAQPSHKLEPQMDLLRIGVDGTMTPEQELKRLAATAIELGARLDLETGMRHLGRVAVEALMESLQQDAVYLRRRETLALLQAELVTETRDGIGYMRVPHLLNDMDKRVVTVLRRWARQDAAGSAIVLDLSRCSHGAPRQALRVIGALAPGKVAFQLDPRDDRTRGAGPWKSEAGFGLPAYEAVPVFVVTSRGTSGVAEAIALALRAHRGAQLFGDPTAGSGVFMRWTELPWQAAAGIAVGDLRGPDGQPIAGHPVLPDACGDHGVLIADDRAGADPGRCRNAGLDMELLWQYVRGRIAQERPEQATVSEDGAPKT